MNSVRNNSISFACSLYNVIKRAHSASVHTDYEMKFSFGPPTRTFGMVRRGGAGWGGVSCLLFFNALHFTSVIDPSKFLLVDLKNSQYRIQIDSIRLL